MLVGRDAECWQVAETLDRARAGVGGLLLVTGPPGLGKTAMLDYAAGAADGLTVLRATGAEFEARFPWAALHHLLQPLFDRFDELPGEQAAALRGALRLGPATGDDPFLVSLAVLTVLSQAADDSGLLCLVDDAQWWDDQSADALRFVARRLTGDSIALIAAARDAPVSRFAADRWPRLDLTGLTGADLAELLGSRLPGPISRSVRERLLDHAGGNPLALLEIAAALTADELAGRRPLPDPLPLSAELETAFLDQVRRLSTEAQQLLLVAACAPGAPWGQVLDAAQRLNLPDRTAELEGERLIRVAPSGARFRHPLVQSAVVGVAPFAQRRAAHLALADTLTQPEDADRRAWHRAAACLGPDPVVADELEASAQRARARSGLAAAAAALERAAELSPDPAAQARRLVAAAEAALQAGQPERALACADHAGRVSAERTITGRVAAVRGQLALRAGRLAEAVGALREGAELVAGSDPLAAAEMLLAAWEAAGYAGDFAAVRQIAAQGRRIPAVTPAVRPTVDLLGSVADILSGQVERGSAAVARVSNEVGVEVDARWLRCIGYATAYQGDIGRSVELFQASAGRARATGALGDLPLSLYLVSFAEVSRGRYPDAEAAAEEGVRLARETGQQTAECVNLASLAGVAALRGDEERCRQFAESALALGIPRQFRLAVARSNWALAVLDLGAGRPDAALRRLRALIETGGHFLVTLFATPDLVEAAVRCNDPETAQQAVARLEPVAANSPEGYAAAWLARCHGLLADDPPKAVKYLREALRLHGLGTDSFARARVELLLGETLRRAKRRTEARDALHSATTSFDALGARAWAERARRELHALGEAPTLAQADELDRLTPQELQIARQVSGGASNRQIAAALFLSPRTVEYHLYKIFPKLGIASRTELAKLVLTAPAAMPG